MYKNRKSMAVKFWVVVLLFCSMKAVAQQRFLGDATGAIRDVQALVGKTDAIKAKIDDVLAYVKENQLYQAAVHGEAMTFPFAVLPDNEDANYALVVNEISTSSTGNMTAEMFMKIPYNSGKNLYFYADGVPMGADGSLQDTMSLYLVSTDTFSIGNGYKLIAKGLEGARDAVSSVSFTCRGFHKLQLSGQLEFNKNTIKAHNSTELVALDFFVSVDKLTNFIVRFDNIPEFNFTKLPGFKIKAPILILDRSDEDKAPGFNLPKWYLDSLAKRSTNFDPNFYAGETWEGVYIPNIVVELPGAFREGETGTSAIITSNDVIVDAYGITALTKITAAEGEHLLSGNIKGFKHNIDSLEINLLASSLSKAGFWGGLSFPLCEEEAKVHFGLSVSQNASGDGGLNYNGYANYEGNLKVNAFGVAQMQLDACEMEFDYSNKQFFPKATLDGKLVIAPKGINASKTAGNLSMEFNELEINSKSPYVSLKELRLNASLDNSKLANLPVSITDVPEVVSENGGQRMGLKIGVAVSLQKSSGNTGSSAGGFSGNGIFHIWAARNPATQRWGYDGFQLNELNINAQGAAFKLKGSLKMFADDPVYHEGYCGKVDLEVIEKFTVSAGAIFGKIGIDESSALEAYEKGESMHFSGNEEPGEGGVNKPYRYWFVDAKVGFSPSIPVFTGVQLNSFTGGLYKNMNMVKEVSGTKLDCQTASGRKYVPKHNVFGLIAGIGVQSPGGGEVYNGNLNFGLEFYTAGGLKRIATWGDVTFFSNLTIPALETLGDKMDIVPAGDHKQEEQASKGAPQATGISANWYIEYDFPNKIFSGNFDLFVNVGGVLKGTGANNKAGHIAFYGSPHRWYMWVGKPLESDMVGLNVIDFLKIQSYLCVGDTLPNPPIAAIPSQIKPPANTIDHNLLAMGGGLSFGSRLSFGNTNNIPLWPCKLKVGLTYQVLAGFDVLLSKSSVPIYCGNSGERGINGWYATGQAYVYGGGALKASWGCAGGGSKNLFSMNLSSYVFAQLPRPSYLRGRVNVGFRVLRWGFSKDFSITLGSQCASAAEESQVYFIEAMNPADSSGNVAVGQELEIYFSKSLYDFTYTIKNSQDPSRTYRAVVEEEHISLTDSKGNALDFELRLAENKQKITLVPYRVLPGEEAITLTVQVMTQVRKGSEWENTEAMETQSVTFTTAEDRNYIPEEDIYYAYPTPSMTNFYVQESSKGFIVLSVLPQKAVQLHPDYEFSVGIYEGNNRLGISRGVRYNDEVHAKNFEFDLPVTALEQRKTYTFRLMKTPVQTYTTEGSTIVGNTEMGTVARNYADTLILSYTFTTSRFASFVEKMGNYSGSLTNVFNGIAVSGGANTALGEMAEPLSELETVGYARNGMLLSDAFIRFGEVNYFPQSVQDIQSRLGTYTGLSLTSNQNTGGYTMVNTLFHDVNHGLNEVNLNCLLQGGCTAEQRQVVKIPKGKFALPVGYYLPGETRPVSEYNLIMDLTEDIVLPF